MNPFKSSIFDGANDLNSYEIYISRLFYREFALSSDGSAQREADEFKDMQFAEKALFGKINASRQPVLPDRSHLVSILGPENKVKTLDFVANAFLDLKSSVDAAIRSGKIDGSDPIFSDFDAKAGLLDADTAYAAYLATFRQFFLSFIENLPSEKKKKVENVSYFTELFLDFMGFFSVSFPLTRSSFVMSDIVSPQSSGMIISIADYNFSSDKEKIKDFYKSNNFKLYKEAAISHGFLIDKNAPWCLVADIDNPVMQSYIEDITFKRSFRRQAFFSTFFQKASLNNFRDLKFIVAELYQATIRKENYDRELTLDSENCFNITLRRRREKTIDEIFKSLTDEEWMKLFLQVKNLETKINYSQAEITSMAKNASDLRKRVDNQTTMGYIDKRFDAIPFSEGSFNYQNAKKDFSEANHSESASASFSEDMKKMTRIKKRTLY